MSKLSCTKCNKLFSDLNLTDKNKSNHIRWCGNTAERGTNKFQKFCCCVVCKLELSVQNLNGHFKSKHIVCEPVPKSYCLQCNKPIYKSQNKFCNQSCATTYNNLARDYTVFKPGPKKCLLEKLKSKQPRKSSKSRKTYTRVKSCIICNKLHPGYGKTCSNTCKSQLLSISMKNAIYDGYDPKKNRGRGKKSWMEISFAQWLQDHDITNYLPEHPFKRLDTIKTYFADFYFPDKDLIIELDGTQHQQTVEYDSERDQYITEVYGLKIVRISYSEYKTQTRLSEIKQLLGIL